MTLESAYGVRWKLLMAGRAAAITPYAVVRTMDACKFYLEAVLKVLCAPWCKPLRTFVVSVIHLTTKEYKRSLKGTQRVD